MRSITVDYFEFGRVVQGQISFKEKITDGDRSKKLR